MGGSTLKHKLRCSLCLLILLGGLLFAGCAAEKPAAESSTAYLTVTDDNGRTVTLAKKPERIVALSASFLEPLQAVDAKLVGRPSSKTGIPAAAEELPEVGAVYQINMEKVIALQPDLVIAYKGMHDKFVPMLESNNIPVLVVDMKTYEAVKSTVQLFSQISGESAKGEALIKAMDEKIQAVQAKLPPTGKRAAILHSTTQQVSVQLEGSIAGSVAQMMGLVNVASGSQPMEKNPDTTPYSLETLVQQNPDIILVTSMGNIESIKKSMLKNVESNPAWQTLPAVAAKQLYFLPQELFLLNPGLHYPEAVETMAKIVYPGVFKDAK